MLNTLYRFARPALFALDPEDAHEATIKALELGVHPRQLGNDDPMLRQTVFGLDFPNPIGVAAGYDKDARVPDASRINFALGTSYAITESITLDAAANYVDFKNASIDRLGGFYVGTPAQTIIRPDGRLTGAHAIVLAVGGRMSF